MRTDEILATWETDGQYRDWFAVDEYKNGHNIRLLVADKERAQAEVIDWLTNKVDIEGYPTEWGCFETSEDCPYFRCLLIPADEAKAYFEKCIEPDEWIPRYEAMEMLGVSKGRISQLVKMGVIASNGNLVSRHDVEYRMHSEPKAGRPSMYVINDYGEKVPYEASVNLMDDDLREELHADLAPCSNQEFFEAYAHAHEERFGEEWVPNSVNPQV